MNEIYRMCLVNAYMFIKSKENTSTLTPLTAFDFCSLLSIMFAKNTEDVMVDYLTVSFEVGE